MKNIFKRIKPFVTDTGLTILCGMMTIMCSIGLIVFSMMLMYDYGYEFIATIILTMSLLMPMVLAYAFDVI